MALGIGANTSIFSLVDTALLRPLAVKEPSQLVELYGTLHNGAEWSLQSYPNYKDYQRSEHRLSVCWFIALWSVVSQSTTPASGLDILFPEIISISRREPMLGRAFLPEEDQSADSIPLP